MQKSSNNKIKEAHWDKVCQNFSDEGSVWADLNSIYDGALPYIVNKIKNFPKTVKILDAGCGDGRNLICVVGNKDRHRCFKRWGLS
ncbi:MAG: hypothetical protein ABIJ91_02585 [Candidatus Kuenenbacteria bacterium]